MEGFRAFRQLCEIPIFQRFRERIKERPHVPPLECVMFRLAPFMQHRRDQTIGAHAVFVTRSAMSKEWNVKRGM